jgi:endonuclease/exonuclease/phosphatase family metal-dependent hydrolase
MMSGSMDSDPLITEPSAARGCKTKFLCPALVVLGVTCFITAIVVSFFSYEASNYQEGVPFRILSLNTWGMPVLFFGGLDKEIRMPAIANMIKKKEFDVYLLEELWMRPDHNLISMEAASVGYYMTAYNSLAQTGCPGLPIFDFWCCDGTDTPSGCSGLAVVSRYPLKQVEFTVYNDHGPMSGGEKMARKGFGRVMIKPTENITVDVFVTHTCASDLESDKVTRMSQVKQLLHAVKNSKADFTVLGGDFNSDPRAINETTYHLLKTDMASSMEDFFQRIASWLIPDKATYGNPRNKYSNMYSPVLYDYIWHRSNTGNLVLTNLFDVPWLTTRKSFTSTEKQDGGEEGKPREKRSVEEATSSEEIINFSDHEAVVASLMLFKKKPIQPSN